MDWQERIAVDPHVLVGKPVVKGTRLAVEFLVDLMAQGWDAVSYTHLDVYKRQVYTLRAYEMAHEREWVGPMFLWNLNFTKALGPEFQEVGYSLSLIHI